MTSAGIATRSYEAGGARPAAIPKSVSTMSFRPATFSVLAITGMFVAASSAMGSSSGTAATNAVSAPSPAASTPAEPSVGFVPAAVPVPLLPRAGKTVSFVENASGSEDRAGPRIIARNAVADLPAVRGIPEIVLAAYRNAELVLAQTEPSCGLTWDLLAGIGRIESGHANGGATDASGTTLSPVLGPALDGTLPGNEIIKNAAGSYVRAVGPMQFLPSTWRIYAPPDANIHNVFDAALAAGKYLCSGGLDLTDPTQKLRAVLRYNNSMTYAQNVLGWAAKYRTGGFDSGSYAAPLPSTAPVDTVPTDTIVPAPSEPATDSVPDPTPAPEPGPSPSPKPPVPMIVIPGLPPIPCGILCPPVPAPASVAPAQAPVADRASENPDSTS